MATKPSPAAGRGQDADRGRDLKALEQRRLKAARLFTQGASQAKVACSLGVSPQTASRWHARWQQGGTRALRAPARQGRPPKLTPVQLRQLERALLKGARGHGFDEELWTLRRVAEVIWRLAGVRYHLGTCGASCAAWAGACSGRSGWLPSATSRRSPAGSSRTGRRSSKL